MKIAVYQTNHEINRRVTQSLWKGLLVGGNDVSINLASSGIVDADVHIAYGILRCCGDVFKAAEKRGQTWFNVDKGFWGAGHYGGLYRVSYRGTQPRWDGGRLRRKHGLSLDPYARREGYTLVCPPTDYVCEFFNINGLAWVEEVCRDSNRPSLRTKSEDAPIYWHDIGCVRTFNSSVAIEAIRRGIPVVSDKTNSSIGSFQDAVGEIHLDHNRRDMLLEWLSAHQMSLNEIERGDIWKIISHYVSTSVTTAESPSPATFVNIR